MERKWFAILGAVAAIGMSGCTKSGGPSGGGGASDGSGGGNNPVAPVSPGNPRTPGSPGSPGTPDECTKDDARRLDDFKQKLTQLAGQGPYSDSQVFHATFLWAAQHQEIESPQNLSRCCGRQEYARLPLCVR